MKIVFMGSDPIALPMLDYIQSDDCAGVTIEAIFTQPDRKTGRGMKLRANAIKTWAQSHGIEVMQPVKCGEPEAAYLKDSGIDLVLVMAYGQILPKSILQATPNKVLNVHASLLPRLRGASPIHTSIAEGLDKTGVSLMEIVPKLDAGPVADHEEIVMGPNVTVSDVIEQMAQASVELIKRGLNKLASTGIEFVEQNSEEVTYCRIIEKTDCHLDFNQPAIKLHNRIRAFQPWPGTAFPLNGLEIRILSAEHIFPDDKDDQPGTVRITSGEMTIACTDGILKPLIMQRPGGKPMPTEEFLRGYPIEDGTVLVSREMRPLEAGKPFPYKKR